MAFSIISVCYNNLNGLEKTLKNIELQTNKDYEVIVIDGNSNDGTKEYLKHNKIISKWISEPDTGVYNAMNKGIALAKNDFIIFMNAGDTFFGTDVLEEISSILKRNPEIEFLYGDTCWILENGEKKLKDFFYPMVEGENICHQSIFYHRNLFAKYGNYDDFYKIYADFDFNLRLLRQYKVQAYHVHIPICYFEFGGLSNNSKYAYLQERERERLRSEWHYENISINDVKKPINIRSEKILNLKEYQKQNSSFAKKLVYRIGDSAGFFSEINNMIFAMIYAYNNNIKFNLSSKNSNIGKNGWNRFFQPFVEEKNSAKLNKYNHRYVSEQDALKGMECKLENNINFLTQDIFPLFFENDSFMQTAFLWPNLHIFGNSFEVASKIARAIYRLNEDSINAINKLKNKIKLPKNYLAVQIRRGDIKNESQWRKQSTLPIDKYIKELIKYSGKNLFVFTDDGSVLEELRTKLPKYKIYTLCDDKEKGFTYTDFEKLSENDRYAAIIKILANIEFCRNSEHFIGTRISNPSIFLSLIMQSKKFSFIDCDFLMWQKQYDKYQHLLITTDTPINTPIKIENVYSQPNKNISKIKLKLFNFIPIFTRIQKNNTFVFKLFGFPLYKISHKANGITSKYYFLGLPIFKISRRKL